MNFKPHLNVWHELFVRMCCCVGMCRACVCACVFIYKHIHLYLQVWRCVYTIYVDVYIYITYKYDIDSICLTMMPTRQNSGDALQQTIRTLQQTIRTLQQTIRTLQQTIRTLQQTVRTNHFLAQVWGTTRGGLKDYCASNVTVGYGC